MKNFLSFRRSNTETATSSPRRSLTVTTVDDEAAMEVRAASNENSPVVTKTTKPRLIRAVGEAGSSIRKAMTTTPRNSGLMECIPVPSGPGHEKVFVHDKNCTSAADEDLHDELPDDSEESKRAHLKEIEMKQLKEKILIAESSVRDEARVVTSAPSSPDRPPLFSPTGVPRFEGMESDSPLESELAGEEVHQRIPQLQRLLQVHGEIGRESKGNDDQEDVLFASPNKQQIIFVKAPKIDPLQIMRTPSRPHEMDDDYSMNDSDSLQGTIAEKLAMEKLATPSTVATNADSPTVDGSFVEDDQDDDETRTTARTYETRSLVDLEDDRDPAEPSGPVEI